MMPSSFSGLLSRRAEERLMAFLAEEGLLGRFSQGVLVALSGGADSVFLLRLLAALSARDGFKLLALHVNHGIRGDEALRDENFCRVLCRQFGVPLTVVTVDVPAEMRARGEGLETVARALRYEALDDCLRATSDVSYIATAHNATDHLETVLQHMLRGGGATALVGIRPVRDRLLRPLLCLSAEEIRSALTAGNIPYVLDSTNTDTSIGRNYVRHEVLPRLSRLTPDPEAAVRRMSEALSHDVLYLEEAAKDVLAAIGRDARGVPKEALAVLPEAILRRVLRLLYTEARRPEAEGTPIEHTHILAISRLLHRDRDFSYAVPDGLYAVADGGFFSFLRSRPTAVMPVPIKLGMGETRFSEDISLFLTKKEGKTFVRCFSKLHKLDIRAAISDDIIRGELYARVRAPGDAYSYGGHTHTIKKLYNEKKIPVSLRAELPILCDGKGILWVPFFPVRAECVMRCE